jgi:hypothetical protein
MYKVRVTTTVEQINHDGRVLFSVTDSVDEGTIDEARNRVDVPAGFLRGMTTLSSRMGAVLRERYESRQSVS